jgi:hypothetical protein
MDHPTQEILYQYRHLLDENRKCAERWGMLARFEDAERLSFSGVRLTDLIDYPNGSGSNL